jgi:hypothetical protein
MVVMDINKIVFAGLGAARPLCLAFETEPPCGKSLVIFSKS